MNLSIFEVLGPVMIGPSSSHTAGAAKLARVAAMIAAKPFSKVEFALHGSFLKTGQGHGTRLALLAGALGLAEDDEGLKTSESLASERGVEWSFTEAELDDAHENTACLTFFHNDGTVSKVTGCSIGGGRIRITDINGMTTDISAEQPTLLIEQNDVSGVISTISTALANEGINIGIMRVGRSNRGGVASTILELDEPVSPALAEHLQALPNVRRVCVINL